ncbi:hypothetical protein E3J61_01645 [Candidatus Dependentiae bacterium]|nr:MAG: hypothetical protein E3J61_01645 [Candidatus Dependentiae bacterium]
MSNTFKRFSMLGLFILLGTIYAQEPMDDSDDIVSMEIAEEIVVPEESEDIEMIDFDIGPDAADEFVLREEGTEDSATDELSSLQEDEQTTVKEVEVSGKEIDLSADLSAEALAEEEALAQEDDIVDELDELEEVDVSEGAEPADQDMEAEEPDEEDEAIVLDEQISAASEVAESVERELSDAIFRDTEKTKREVAREVAISPSDMTFDVDKKRKETIDLVHRAVQELKTQPLDIACNRFSHTKNFVYGDLYIFLFDVNGINLAHGEDAQLIWKNLYDLKDWVGTFIVQELIKKAKAGGGWVTYGWRNATKSAYVKLVEKEGKAYVVGSGYFSHSKEEAVVNIVKGGVATFDRIKKEKQPVDWAFSRMSYPGGQFVAGDLYLYALDFQGNIMAQGDRPGLIGSNAWNYQDANDLYVNREIVKKLKNTTEGVWVEYVSKRATKKAYAQRVKGPDGKQYFIACGYYPEADRAQAVELVRKGYSFMKTHGKTSAVTSFSERRSDDFRYGDLDLIVYDLKGKVIADGGNADNIGRRMYNTQDEDGVYYVQSILKRATKEGIWTNAKIRGAFQSTYSQRIDLGIAQYVITCSYYPVSKPETMTLLVQSGASYLKANPREKAFAEFVEREGKFQRGDLKLTVVDTMGLCYAYGDDADLIWRNIFKAKDDDGRQFIKMFINEAQQGPSVIKTKLNRAEKTNFVVSVEKEGKTYIVSSGYYQ